eukprot:SM000317S12252  [mRNA]  locus=s317:115357:121313:- [translate_table: standard]
MGPWGLLLAALLAAAAVSGLAQQGSTLINCGGQGFTDSMTPKHSSPLNARYWSADSNNGGISESTVSSIANLVFASLELYQTANYIDAPKSLSYNITLPTGGRHFVRLHFAAIQPQIGPYPDPSKALFNVTATSSGSTFLLLFNYSVTQQASAQVHFLAETGCQWPSWRSSPCPWLTPQTSHSQSPSLPVAGSFAFVNGIEVVPSDEDLYYQQPVLTSNQQPTTLLDGKALKREYRLNCGGSTVSSTSDKVFRTWTQNDLDFILHSFFIHASSKIVTSKIKDTNSPPYYTPPAVARSDRNLGQVLIDGNLNLTYMFPLDDGWSYLVRTIFSENVFANPFQRVMDVFLNKIFVGQYDIARLAKHGKNSAYVKDFVVSLPVGQGSLQLDLGISSQSKVKNVEIAGIEILKIGTVSLAEPGYTIISSPPPPPATVVAPPPAVSSAPPPPATMVAPPPAGGHKKSSSTGAVVGGIVGGIAAALTIATLAYVFCIRGRKRDQAPPLLDPKASVHGLFGSGSDPYIKKLLDGSVVSNRFITHHGPNMRFGQSKQVGREFTFQELQVATTNFADDMVIGVGGFGKVFKGVLADGTKVAVKRCSPDSHQGIAEFHMEIKLLTQLRHRHLVSLIGYCEEGVEMLLVYDFMSNGVLRSHLYGKDAALHHILSWKQRLEICIGAARGLYYLHSGVTQSIIHRDVKSTNILLDDNFVAKVADFGLSRLGPGLDESHVSTGVKGSVGYLDPQYFRRLQLTEKSDVYGFGVVLLEVICARAPINTEMPDDQLVLVEWAQSHMKDESLDQIVDPKMAGTYNWASVEKVAELALKCVSHDGSDRPPMRDVLWHLEYALTLQESDSASDVSIPTTIRQDNSRPGVQDTSRTTTGSYGSIPGPRGPVSTESSRASLEDFTMVPHGR